MKRYLSIEPIAELEEMSKSDQKRIWRRGQLKAFRYRETWAAYAGIGAWSGLGGAIGASADSHSIIGAMIGGAIGGAIGGFVFGPLIGGIARVCVIEQLKCRQQESGTDENE